ANVHDVAVMLAVLVACPPAGYGGPGRTPARLLGDRAYDSQAHEAVVRWMGVEPAIAPQRTAHGSGLGRERHVVERTIAAAQQNRRLKVRYERRADTHRALLTLACIKVCWYRLR
ncbi:MAG: IS5/IS1182 family transposase, partial [Gemmataceae bacterium]|nr:IS5/IS1182 family transposase [Gemmataceae bacterium]